MQKIDKTQILSTNYKKWEENLEVKNLPHPKYNSSKSQYYTDIVMNLFYCQKGLCAYTEVELCTSEYFTTNCWENGRYKNDKPEFLGQLEHFDESLKSKSNDKQGQKDWLWDNFFMVDSDINTKVKRQQTIDYILKPDNENYNPFKLLDYDLKRHRFTANYANNNLSDNDKDRIEKMIKILGLNFASIVNKRKHLLEDVVNKHRLDIEVNATSTGEFPTAFQFLINEFPPK